MIDIYFTNDETLKLIKQSLLEWGRQRCSRSHLTSHIKGQGDREVAGLTPVIVSEPHFYLPVSA